MSDYTWFQEDPFLDGLLPRADEPTEAVPIGNPTQAPIGIYLSQEVAHFIDTFIQADRSRALGGILVGHVGSNGQRPFILITGAIEAKRAVGDGEELRFVSSTWQYIQEIWNREYPDTLVIGWFRTKPDRGISLSEYDQFTHSRLFKLPWQVNFIIDPVQLESCFYCWVGDYLVPVDSFYLWNPAKSIPLINALVKSGNRGVGPAAPSSRAARRLSHRPSPMIRLRRTSLWLVLLLLFILGSVSLFPWLANNMPGTKKLLADANTALQVLDEHIEEAKAAQTVLQAQPLQAQDIPISEDAPLHDILEADVLLSVKADVPSENSDLSPVTVASYVVEQGDTLWAISDRTFGNPHAYRALAEMNQITDPDLIYPGMQLQLETEKQTDDEEETSF